MVAVFSPAILLLLLLLPQGRTAVPHEAECAIPVVRGSSWCNTGIRRLDVQLDVGIAQTLGFTTSVPVFFGADDDVDELSTSLVDLYLLDRKRMPVLAQAMRDELSSAAPTEERCAEPSKFFVEIGTSDFGTLHQQLYTEPEWEGVAVEPLPALLDSLPSRPGLFKENGAFGCGAAAARSGHTHDDESIVLYALDRASVERLGLPHWALGTGSLSLELARHTAKNSDWSDALREFVVPCLSWAELAKMYGLPGQQQDQQGTRVRVDVIKIDAEGLDFDIVDEILEWHEQHRLQRERWPGQICFEALRRSGEQWESTMARLKAAGYECSPMGIQDIDCVLR